MVAITIFISFMAFAIIMISHDIFSRNRYDKIVRELNKRIMVFENTNEFGAVFHVKWKFKITRKGVFFIGNEVTDKNFQPYLLYDKNSRMLSISRGSRYYSNLMMDKIKDLEMTITPCKNLLKGNTVRFGGTDMSLVSPNQIMDKFLSKTEGKAAKSRTTYVFYDIYTAALCFKHGRFITAKNFDNFMTQTRNHVKNNILNILRQRNKLLKHQIIKMKESE